MHVSIRRRLRVAVMVAVASVLAATAIVSVGAAAPSAKKQRIAIEATATTGVTRNRWKLEPLTAGTLKADAGAFTMGGQARLSMRDGQSVTLYRAAILLTSKVGTLTIPHTWVQSQASGGFAIGEITWSIRYGSDAYFGLHGGGRGSAVLRRGTWYFRLEGYVS